MQFSLKSSKMDSILESDLQIKSKTKKNHYFLLFFSMAKIGVGPVFWRWCMSKSHFFELICKSDSKIESIFELFSKNCIDIGGVARSYKLISRSSPPMKIYVEVS